MKKIVIGLSSIVILTACEQLPQESKDNAKSVNIHHSRVLFHEIEEFQYKGHEYIKFTRNTDSNAARMGISHSPDCKKCLKKCD